MRMRRIAAVLLALFLATPALPAHPVSKPRLVIVLMVDGLSWERLNAWRPWFTSGLKRLLDEGAVASECRYPHLNTVTGPGHASVATGAMVLAAIWTFTPGNRESTCSGPVKSSCVTFGKRTKTTSSFSFLAHARMLSASSRFFEKIVAPWPKV